MKEEIDCYWYTVEVEETHREIYEVFATNEETALDIIGDRIHYPLWYVRKREVVKGSYLLTLKKVMKKVFAHRGEKA